MNAAALDVAVMLVTGVGVDWMVGRLVGDHAKLELGHPYPGGSENDGQLVYEMVGELTEERLEELLNQLLVVCPLAFEVAVLALLVTQGELLCATVGEDGLAGDVLGVVLDLMLLLVPVVSMRVHGEDLLVTP